jgi:hypothetical protein
MVGRFDGLRPLKCERLMGQHDGYTAIPIKGKIAADGPRYKALGNSMAVSMHVLVGQADSGLLQNPKPLQIGNSQQTSGQQCCAEHDHGNRADGL